MGNKTFLGIYFHQLTFKFNSHLNTMKPFKIEVNPPHSSPDPQKEEEE